VKQNWSIYHKLNNISFAEGIPIEIGDVFDNLQVSKDKTE